MKLDEALKQASAEASRTTMAAVPGPLPPTERRRPLGLVAMTLLLVGGLAVALVVADNEQGTVSTDATDSDTAAGNPVTGSPVVRYLSDAPPDGLSLVYAGPVARLEPTGTETRWIYGHDDRGPAGDERAIVIMVLRGAAAPQGLLAGRDVDINGVDGRVLPDGVVMFFAGKAMVSVNGDTAHHDLVAVARTIEVMADGEVVPPPGVPGGYVLLGSFDEAMYAEVDGAVPADGQVSTYRQGYMRYLGLTSRPRTATLEHMYSWLTRPDAETVTVGGRTLTYMRLHEEFGARSSRVVWFEDGVIGQAISYGIERPELDRALAGLRVDDGQPRVTPDDQ